MKSHASYIYSTYSFINSLPEEQIEQIGNLKMDGNPIPSFDENLLIKLCEDVTQIFRKEDNIIEINGDVIIVGDIHGSLHDLFRIIKYIEQSNLQAIFLGDYVDRGDFSLECITLLFSMKVLKPNSIYLLRGNHEFNELCSNYGFKKEILSHNKSLFETTDIIQPKITDEIHINFDYTKNQRESKEKFNLPNQTNTKCYQYHKKLYDAFMKAFSYLPICAIANKTTICLHGGLTPLLDTIENIRDQIQRPITTLNENQLLSDITWGDPGINLTHPYEENPRGKGKIFSRHALFDFLNKNNLTRLVRGHEFIQNGIEELFNSKCITVFSASSYNYDMSNSCGILRIYEKDDNIKPIFFTPLKRLKKSEAIFFKVQSFASISMKTPNFNRKFGSMLSFSKMNSENLNINNHFNSSRSCSNNDENIMHMKIHQTGFERQKKINCMINCPHIFIPHVNKN